MKGANTTAKSPRAYIAALDPERRDDVARLDRLIRKTAPGLKPFIHAGMLAYGKLHYRYASGREGEWFKLGIASNARYISLYACAADGKSYVAERYKARLPKANIGRACVRFRRLADLDLDALADLIREAERTGFGI